MVANQCTKMGFILRILAELFYYVRIIVPILLIILVVFDLVKVIVGQADEKAKNEATNKIVKRLIYAILVFLVPTLINLIFITIEKYGPTDSNGTPTGWVTCWTQYYK